MFALPLIPSLSRQYSTNNIAPSPGREGSPRKLGLLIPSESAASRALHRGNSRHTNSLSGLFPHEERPLSSRDTAKLKRENSKNWSMVGPGPPVDHLRPRSPTHSPLGRSTSFKTLLGSPSFSRPSAHGRLLPSFSAASMSSVVSTEDVRKVDATDTLWEEEDSPREHITPVAHERTPPEKDGAVVGDARQPRPAPVSMQDSSRANSEDLKRRVAEWKRKNEELQRSSLTPSYRGTNDTPQYGFIVPRGACSSASSSLQRNNSKSSSFRRLVDTAAYRLSVAKLQQQPKKPRKVRKHQRRKKLSMSYALSMSHLDQISIDTTRGSQIADMLPLHASQSQATVSTTERPILEPRIWLRDDHDADDGTPVLSKPKPYGFKASRTPTLRSTKPPTTRRTKENAEFSRTLVAQPLTSGNATAERRRGSGPSLQWRTVLNGTAPYLSQGVPSAGQPSSHNALLPHERRGILSKRRTTGSQTNSNRAGIVDDVAASALSVAMGVELVLAEIKPCNLESFAGRQPQEDSVEIIDDGGSDQQPTAFAGSMDSLMSQFSSQPSWFFPEEGTEGRDEEGQGLQDTVPPYEFFKPKLDEFKNQRGEEGGAEPRRVQSVPMPRVMAKQTARWEELAVSTGTVEHHKLRPPIYRQQRVKASALVGAQVRAAVEQSKLDDIGDLAEPQSSNASEGAPTLKPSKQLLNSVLGKWDPKHSHNKPRPSSSIPTLGPKPALLTELEPLGLKSAEASLYPPPPPFQSRKEHELATLKALTPRQPSEMMATLPAAVQPDDPNFGMVLRWSDVSASEGREEAEHDHNLDRCFQALNFIIQALSGPDQAYFSMIVSQLHELVYSEYVAPSATQDSPTEEDSVPLRRVPLRTAARVLDRDRVAWKWERSILQHQLGEVEAEKELRQSLNARINKDTMLQEILRKRYEREAERISRVVRNLKRAGDVDQRYVIQHGVRIDTNARLAEQVEEEILDIEEQMKLIQGAIVEKQQANKELEEDLEAGKQELDKCKSIAAGVNIPWDKLIGPDVLPASRRGRRRSLNIQPNEIAALAKAQAALAEQLSATQPLQHPTPRKKGELPPLNQQTELPTPAAAQEEIPRPSTSDGMPSAKPALAPPRTPPASLKRSRTVPHRIGTGPTLVSWEDRLKAKNLD